MSDTEKTYDVVIIGGGPAGLSAAIYTARDRLSTLMVEKSMVGGLIVNTDFVENYPGAPDISGYDLTQLMYRQATKFGLETASAEVTALRDGRTKTVVTTGGDYRARAVIIAGGSERQKLGVPGEAEFTGKGVSYCATCDAAFFRDKTVVVVGGGNAALTEAVHLSKFAGRVVVIHRRNELRAMPSLQEKAKAEPKIEFRLESIVEEILADTFVNGVRLRPAAGGKSSRLEADGVFVAVGLKPNTGYLGDLLKLDAAGAIITDDAMETGVPGIFAAGDIRSNSIRQVVSATGDGAVAAVSAGKYLG